jgi:hypothetical protein
MWSINYENQKTNNIFAPRFRGVAQLVAHLVWDQRVVSSSLATPTKERARTLVPGFFF